MKAGVILVILGLLCIVTFVEASMNMEYILDASNSMTETLPSGEKKIDAAKKVLCGLVDNIAVEAKDVNVGLRIYGANFDPTKTKEVACKDSVLVIPISKIDANLIKQKVMSTNAAGCTPIAYSLELASKDFVIGEGQTNIIVLVSDGIETCGGDPVAVAKRLVEQGFGIKIYTIGFTVDEETRKQLEAVASVTGGSYYDAKDAAQLQKSLEEVKTRALEDYESAGQAVQASLWIADAPEVKEGEYKGTLAMHEVKFYKVYVQKGQEIKATLVVKKAPFEGRTYIGSVCTFQTFSIKFFDTNLKEVCAIDKVIEGNPAQPETFKAEWTADIPGWVYIAIAASKNHDENGNPITLIAAPDPSEYTLKVNLKGGPQETAQSAPPASYAIKEANGGGNFEKAEEISVNTITKGDIYMTETRYFKMPVSGGQKNFKVTAVVQKSWYEARNYLSSFEINMTYVLTVYDEDWAEIMRRDLTLSKNPANAYAITVDIPTGDNEELYISLSASDNHQDGNPTKSVGEVQKQATRFSILATVPQ